VMGVDLSDKRRAGKVDLDFDFSFALGRPTRAIFVMS